MIWQILVRDCIQRIELKQVLRKFDGLVKAPETPCQIRSHPYDIGVRAVLQVCVLDPLRRGREIESIPTMVHRRRNGASYGVARPGCTEDA